jgi:ParB family transcriptional regulator, chromosome partitioning protein
LVVNAVTQVLQVMMIALAELIPDPSQPRKTFVDEEIQRLAVSIAARGVLQPLRVMRDEQRQVWVIQTGESRWRAAKLAGLTHVPCLPVAMLEEVDKLADRLTENDVRHDLQPMEAARALARLKALKGCNSKTLVEEYGFSGAAISKAEALLSLPPDIQELVGSGPGQIAPATGYELSRLPDEQSQRELAHAVVARHLPRHAVVEAVQSKVGKRNVAPKAGRLSCKLDGGISVTVSSADTLTWDDLLTALDHIRKQAKKLYDDGKEVSALARVLRAS